MSTTFLGIYDLANKQASYIIKCIRNHAGSDQESVRISPPLYLYRVLDQI